MKHNIKNILIGLGIIIGVSFVYFYFFQAPKKDTGSSLSSSKNSKTGNEDTKISEDTAFLSTLIGLSNIKIDTSLFTSKSFSSLVDNTVSIGPVGTPGRPDPFAPIGVSTSVESTSFSNPDFPVTSSATLPTVTTPLTNTSTNTVLDRLLNNNSIKQ